MSDSSLCSGDSDSFSEGDLEEILEHLEPDVSILPYQFKMHKTDSLKIAILIVATRNTTDCKIVIVILIS